MTLILDTSTLKESLYVTNLKLSVPQKSINIDAKDLIDDGIAEAWATDGARVSFSLNISKRVNEFIDKMNVSRRNIVSRLMFDGSNFLLFESGLNDYLTDCKQLDDEFANQLEEILEDWETIKADFEFALSEKMTVALTKSFSSHNKTSIEEQVDKACELYMSRKFPSVDVVRDKCAVIYDTPRLFKQAAPTGLTPEAFAAYEKSQEENLKIIYDLLVRDYLSLELDVCVGFLDDLVKQLATGNLPPIFQQNIVAAINGEFDSSVGKEEFDLALGDTQKEKSEDVEIQSRIAELVNSEGVRKYNVFSYKKLLGRSKAIAENLANSIPMLAKLIDATKLEDMGVMLANCKLFYSWCEEWLKEYEVTGKKSKKLFVSPVPVVTNSIQEVTKEVEEIIEVERVLASELDNIVFLPEIKDKPKVTEEIKVEIDNDDSSDFDLAI